jgi:predicted acylesterase/phospholipase RssA
MDWKQEKLLCKSCLTENNLEEIKDIDIKFEEIKKEEKSLIDKIENLSFAGGGMRCVSYIGGLYVLEELGILKNIKRVSGTSGGSLIGLLITLGYNIDEIFKIITQDQSKYMDRKGVFFNWWYYLFRNNFGLYKGVTLEEDIKEFINSKIDKDFPNFRKSKDYNPTFMDIYKLYNRELVVTGTNLSKSRVEYFCPKLTPNMPVYIAVRISASLPGCFESVIYNNNRYIDGGLAENYPLDIYCDKFKNKYFFCEPEEDLFERTLGFALMTSGTVYKKDKDGYKDEIEYKEDKLLVIHNSIEYLSSIVDFYCTQNMEDEILFVNLMNNKKKHSFIDKTILGYTPCLSTTDFSASLQKKVNSILILKYLTILYIYNLIINKEDIKEYKESKIL